MTYQTTPFSYSSTQSSTFQSWQRAPARHLLKLACCPSALEGAVKRPKAQLQFDSLIMARASPPPDSTHASLLTISPSSHNTAPSTQAANAHTLSPCRLDPTFCLHMSAQLLSLFAPSFSPVLLHEVSPHQRPQEGAQQAHTNGRAGESAARCGKVCAGGRRGQP